MGLKVVPALVVFQTPPEAVAMYHTRLSVGSTARSMMRPEIMAGPIWRNSRPAKVFSPYFDSCDAGFASAPAAFLSAFLSVFVSGAARRGRVSVARANRIVVNRSFISDLSDVVCWSGRRQGSRGTAYPKPNVCSVAGWEVSCNLTD